MSSEPCSSSESDRKDIVVIGAGFVGLSCALWLLRSGHRVTVVDHEPPSASTDYRHACSYGNACTIALGACLPVAMPGILSRVPGMLLDRDGPLSIYWRDLLAFAPWLYHFVRASGKRPVEEIVAVLGEMLRLAEEGHASLIAEANVRDLVRRHGCMYVYRTPEEFQAARTEIALREREQVRMEIFSADDIRDREPNLAPHYHRGVLFSDAYHLDTPHRYALGLASAVAARGGRFLRGDARLIGSGSRVEVDLKGTVLRPHRVVVAGGAWSAKLAAQIGERIRLETERGYHVEFATARPLLHSPTCYPSAGFYMVPLSQGLRAAGTVELGGLDKPFRAVRAAVIERRARFFLPALGKKTSDWLGFRPSMPDSIPVIGRSSVRPDVLYAFGHGHIGLTLAGITGRIVCDLVNGDTPPIDLSPLRPNRY